MDPISLLAAATAAFEGVKKAVEVGREVQDVFGQLSEWANYVGQLNDYLADTSAGLTPKKYGLFDKITFKESETSEAFNAYVARQKIKDMEKEIYFMFHYGELQHLGRDGYNELMDIRLQIRIERRRILEAQALDRKNFVDNLKVAAALTFAAVVVIAVVWVTAVMIIEQKEQEKQLKQKLIRSMTNLTQLSQKEINT